MPAHAAAAEDRPSSQAVEPSATLTRPASPTQPPRDHFLNAVQAARIAARHPKVRDELRGRDGVTRRAFAKGPGRWQVSWYAGGDEIAQAVVDEREGRAVEVWTGPQVAWQMARGLEGAFGRRVNSPWVWIPLMVAFFVAFFDPRRPLRLLHLDLLVLLAFSISHLFFNRGEIHTSVPLVYPVLGLPARPHADGGWGRRAAAAGVPFTLVPIRFLALALIFLVGFRVGLNLTDSNVIDVGYSGVIGADRITHGEDLYGTFPDENAPATHTGRSPTTPMCRSSWRFRGPAVGRPAGCSRGGAAFDLATMLALFFVGGGCSPGRGKRPRSGARVRMGGLSVHLVRAQLECERLPRRAAGDARLAGDLVATSTGAALALAAAAKFAPLALFRCGRRTTGAGADALAFALAFGP